MAAYSSSAVVLLIVALCGGMLYRSSSTHEIGTAQTQKARASLAHNIDIAWPTTGSAAIGSVGDGVLASSPDGEIPRQTASIAKIITALAVLKKQPIESGQHGVTYTLSAADVANYTEEAANGGSVVPVYEGMEITQYQALQLMLLVSANNIADTLVDKVFGSEGAYTEYAQDMLLNMGLTKSVVADASGMSSETVSTPAELVQIGIAALNNPVIADIVSQARVDIPGVGVITNTNKMLGSNGVVGIKTGTTDEAGSCLLFAAKYVTNEKQPVTLVGVIMGEDDSETLYDDSDLLLTLSRQVYGLSER
jgi:D-alanyl-D-alanine carboxypeptidase (penicillin-binding protein 5/6)